MKDTYSRVTITIETAGMVGKTLRADRVRNFGLELDCVFSQPEHDFNGWIYSSPSQGVNLRATGTMEMDPVTHRIYFLTIATDTIPGVY